MKTLLKNGYVWNGEGFTVQSVLMGDHDILEVGQFDQDPADCEIIDMTGKYLMPGIIDAHIHINQTADPDPELPLLNMNLFDMLLVEVKNCKELLKAGITTTRDCGALGTETIALRNAIEDGKIVGPTLLSVASPITTIGGHYGAYRMNGPMEFRRKTRELLEAGVDWIKVMTTGSIPTGNRTGGGHTGDTEILRDELDAIMEVAHNNRLPVTCHCMNKESLLNAIHAGANMIEHAVGMDEEVMDLLVEKNIPIGPTLYCFQQIVKYGVEGGIPAPTVKVTEEILEPQIEALKKAYKRGVTFVASRDGGSFYVPQSDFAGELLAYENTLGMSRVDCIKTCTENAAKAFRMWDRAGSIEKGKWADILVINNNPLDDLHAFYDAYKVYKFGKDVDRLLVD